MTEESHPKSWLTRLGDALSREPQTQHELIELLRDASERDLLDKDALIMIESILHFSEQKVRDVMVPRAQMVMIDHDMAPHQALNLVIESGHSRFPVLKKEDDEVLGILLAKDLLPIAVSEDQNNRVSIQDITRPATFIPEGKRLDMLLKDFQAKRAHMAVVLDEYGSISGLVTIEDVLEEIVGEIVDETDQDSNQDNIQAFDDNSYLVNPLIPIEAFNTFFESDFSNDEFDTIGGAVMQALGRLPTDGESVDINTLHFTVLRADNRRIKQLQVQRH